MTQSRSAIAKIWTGFWKLITWLRVATLNLVFLVIMLVLLISVFGSPQLTIPQEGPLLVTPSGYLVDQESYRSPSALLMDNDNMPAETLVRDLVQSIEIAAKDDNVTALILELNYLLGGGLSKLEEIGTALETFKKSGKPIIAYADHYTQTQYYLASYADEIYLNDMGALLLTGFGMYQHYMKDGLDKLNVKVHVFRVGSYKDFVEPFTRNSMSESSRQHTSQWVNELWGIYSSRIETARQLPAGALHNFINNMDTHLQQVGGDNAQLALTHGLVDQITSRVAMRDILIERFGADDYGDSFKFIPQRHYLAQKRIQLEAKPDRVALIVASGTIMDGEQPAGSIGSDTLSRIIRTARDDDAVKALVLRVDSGGGSALASEIIREELAATREAGKPVIVSMGSLAASGGYWLSAPADQVWATPTTLTGSIGVFGIFPTFETTLSNLGVHLDGVGTTDLAGSDRLDRALPAEAGNVIQASVESIYRRFINIVADARNMTPEDVHEIAQGRVWTGATAAELGLVDKLGYLNDAVAAAAETAGLDQYSVELFEQELTPMEQILRAFQGEVRGFVHYLQGTAVTSTLTAPQAPLIGGQTSLAKFYRQLQHNLSPVLDAKNGGIYAQCLQCGAL